MTAGPAFPSGPGAPTGETTPPSLRAVAEMLSRVRRVLADGIVTEEEARSLAAFVRARPSVAAAWPGDVLFRRLQQIFDDGRVDEDEREQLERLLARILEAAGDEGPGSGPAVPYDDPLPMVRFRDRTFVFVGPLASGSLGRIHRQVVLLGGRYATTVSPETDYVVVGGVPEVAREGSQAAAELSRAVELRDGGLPLAILPEEEFSRALPQDPERGPRQRA